ncbi:MAG TPA: HNH endonuclease [Symbiobacteriaceae bacterium]|nr:HNH endonuclease [Symbiobacteriaceae bacterium]
MATLKAGRKVWKFSPGKGGRNWAEYRTTSVIALGWGADQDVGALTAQKIELAYRGRPNIARQLIEFVHEVQCEDYVVVYAKGRILGVGVVTGEYEFAHGESAPHRRAVGWLYTSVGGWKIRNGEDDWARQLAFYALTSAVAQAEVNDLLATVTAIESLVPGSVFANKDITRSFRVGNEGGIRKSGALDALIVTVDYSNGLYSDRRVGDRIYYVGQGARDDQRLDSGNNRELSESTATGTPLYLFEVQSPDEYVFLGKARLDGAPYREKQRDTDGKWREVWVFPLGLLTGSPLPISQKTLQRIELSQAKEVATLSTAELQKRAEAANPTPAQYAVTGNAFVRNEAVAAYARELAKGVCALCRQLAPFKNKKQQPFLETHHVKWLACGGEDSISNTVALCPNCHRKMHIVNDPKDVKALRAYIKSRSEQVASE